MALTAIQVKGAKGVDKPQKLSDGGGLYLLVHPNGAKYWRFDYRFAGKRKTLAVGVYPDVSLGEGKFLDPAELPSLPSEVTPNVPAVAGVIAESSCDDDLGTVKQLVKVQQRCAFIKWASKPTNQPNVNEPQWHSLISNLCRFEGGEAANSQQKFIWMVGAGGNGKSVLLLYLSKNTWCRSRKSRMNPYT